MPKKVSPPIRLRSIHDWWFCTSLSRVHKTTHPGLPSLPFVSRWLHPWYRVPRSRLLGGIAVHSMQMVTSNSHLQNSSSSMETTSLKGALDPPQNPPTTFKMWVESTSFSHTYQKNYIFRARVEQTHKQKSYQTNNLKTSLSNKIYKDAHCQNNCVHGFWILCPSLCHST